MIPRTSISAASGLPCPESGIWESTGNFRTTVTLFKGAPMPNYCGMKIKWRLIQTC